MSFNMEEVAERFKRMREFVIEVEVPEGKTLSGVMPFEPLINSSKGRFKVYATSYEEANRIITDYLKK